MFVIDVESDYRPFRCIFCRLCSFYALGIRRLRKCYVSPVLVYLSRCQSDWLQITKTDLDEIFNVTPVAVEFQR